MGHWTSVTQVKAEVEKRFLKNKLSFDQITLNEQKDFYNRSMRHDGLTHDRLL